MAGRPCNPDSDLRRLWQVLLRGTPFPQRGTPRDPDKFAADSEPLQTHPADALALPADDPGKD